MVVEHQPHEQAAIFVEAGGQDGALQRAEDGRMKSKSAEQTN